ncbi:hypothetical protein [Paenibacillus pedocola]|uniref:hypothetical protein n=1 Tax=Paenibacillus pedocola TaxID=3242193 RepID=UPI002877AFB9|nr:hypothetical protein [Paenibacillus typhae]
MNKYNDLISDFYQIQEGFGYLTSFRLTRGTEIEGLEVSLQITLSKSTFDYDEQLLITFTGVQDLTLGHLTGLFWLAFDISDISKDQLEGIRYKVDECEGNVFSLYCSQITFEVLV